MRRRRDLDLRRVDIAKNDHVMGATDERGHDAAKPMRFANSTAKFDRCAAYLGELAESKSDLLVSVKTNGYYWLPLFCRLQDEGYCFCQGCSFMGGTCV